MISNSATLIIAPRSLVDDAMGLPPSPTFAVGMAAAGPRLPHCLLPDPDLLIDVDEQGWSFQRQDLKSAPKSFCEDVLQSCRPLVMFLGERHQFVAEIGGRGLRGTYRTLCLQNLRLFGDKRVVAQHVWVDLSRVWNAAEPLIQGNRVIIDATVMAYARSEVREFRHGAVQVRVEGDAGLLVHKVFALGGPKPANSLASVSAKPGKDSTPFLKRL